MHRKTQISVLVYNALYPNPTSADPPSFGAHLEKNLVGEVRIETQNFYGALVSVEARYPGLNYAHAPHRKRLGRFPHHKRLFDVFDQLGLTESEIRGFCRWEGTLWARQRYERDEGIKVRDTTGIEIGEWVDTRKTRGASHSGPTAKGINVKVDIEVEIEEVADGEEVTDALRPTDTEMQDGNDDDAGDDAETENEPLDPHNLDDTTRSELNARLAELTANMAMDPAFELYLKEALERGGPLLDERRVLAHILQERSRLSASAPAPACPPDAAARG